MNTIFFTEIRCFNSRDKLGNLLFPFPMRCHFARIGGVAIMISMIPECIA